MTSSAVEQFPVGDPAASVVVLVVVAIPKLRLPDPSDLGVAMQALLPGQEAFEEVGSVGEDFVVGLTEAEEVGLMEVEEAGSMEAEEVGLTEAVEVASEAVQEGVLAIEVGMVVVAEVLDTNPTVSAAAHRQKERLPAPEAAEEAALGIEVGIAVWVVDLMVEDLRMGPRMAPATQDDLTTTDLRRISQVATARVAAEAAAMLSR